MNNNKHKRSKIIMLILYRYLGITYGWRLGEMDYPSVAELVPI